MERGLLKTSAGYIHYRATGSGNPIILLHINQQSSATFLELMGVLGKQLRVFAIDYPSNGMSDHIGGQPAISDYAGYVVEVMDALGIFKSAFLGEALGAIISVEMANRYPTRVEKVVLVNCPFWLDTESHRATHNSLKGNLRPADDSGFPSTRTIEFLLENDPQHAPVHPTQSWMDRINQAQVGAGRDRWQGLNALDNYDIATKLKGIACPALLVTGEHFIYSKLRNEFASRVRDLETVVVEGGRFCLAWEHADRVGQATLEFLAKN